MHKQLSTKSTLADITLDQATTSLLNHFKNEITLYQVPSKTTAFETKITLKNISQNPTDSSTSIQKEADTNNMNLSTEIVAELSVSSKMTTELSVSTEMTTELSVPTEMTTELSVSTEMATELSVSTEMSSAELLKIQLGIPASINCDHYYKNSCYEKFETPDTFKVSL